MDKRRALMQRAFKGEPNPGKDDAKSLVGPQAENGEKCMIGVMPFKYPLTSKCLKESAKIAWTLKYFH